MAQTLKSVLERENSMRSFQATHPKSVHSIPSHNPPLILFSHTYQYLYSFLTYFLFSSCLKYSVRVKALSDILSVTVTTEDDVISSISLFLVFSFSQALKRERMLLTGSAHNPQKHVLDFPFLGRIGI